jgi:PAS domain-containing protein
MKLSTTSIFIIAIMLALLVVFAVDPLDPSTLSTPFCFGLIVMGLSLRQRVWLVLSISLIYCVLVVFAMVHFLEFAPGPNPHPIFWFFQRFGLFLIVCGMGVYLSSYRENTERNLTHIQGILSKLPAPVVISDAAGYITYVNEAICTFFKQPATSLIGKRYADLFMSDTQEGKAMRYYIDLFADQTNSMHELELRPSVSTSNINACITCLGTGIHRNMITVLQTTS